MGGAWIDGRPVALESAVAEAARLLGAGRFPLIAGLGTDIHGARAAIALAERLGGAVDHMNSSSLLRDIDVLREAGLMVTTPNEAGLRADTLLLIGTGLTAAWPELPQRLIARPPGREVADGFARRVLWLCGGPEAKRLRAGEAGIRMVGRESSELTAVLAAVRARVAGRPVAGSPLNPMALDALAADLQAARFGVAVWSAAELDVLTVEMLCGLVKDLNVRTRFSGLPLSPGDNGSGALQACGWMTGFPLRIGFGRGFPEHDAWRYDATRLVESGEADCAMWISAYRVTAPQWQRGSYILGSKPPRI